MLTIIRQYKILCRSTTSIIKNIPTLSITQKRQKSIKVNFNNINNNILI